jgi:hypothetical protein
MTRQHPRDDQRYAGAYPAALLCHLNGDTRQSVDKPIPDVVGACQFEEPLRDLVGTDLEYANKPLEQKLGNRNRKEQEQQGKSRSLESFGAEG